MSELVSMAMLGPRLIQRPGIVRNHYQLAQVLNSSCISQFNGVRNLLDTIMGQRHCTHTLKFDV